MNDTQFICDLSKPKKWNKLGFAVSKYTDGGEGLIFTSVIPANKIKYTIPQFDNSFTFYQKDFPIQVGGWCIDRIEMVSNTRNNLLHFYALLADGSMPCATIPKMVIQQLVGKLLKKKLIKEVTNETLAIKSN